MGRAVLWAMGLEREFAALLEPEIDTEGMALERARAPRRVRPRNDMDADF